MRQGTRSWTPVSSASWAQQLGMVRVPLFGWAKAPPVPGDHAVLLDGAEGSFAFFTSAGPKQRLEADDRLLSWSWSAHVRHALIVTPDIDRMFLRRWDSPRIVRQFSIPRRGLGAEELLALLEGAPPPRCPSIIQHVLHGFRLIRQALPAEDTLPAIKLLNAFLLGTKAVQDGYLDGKALRSAGTFGEVLEALPRKERELARVVDVAKAVRSLPAGVLAHHFLDPEPRSCCELHPDLLFRHAAGQLYQEAHLEVERDPQSYMAGLGPTEAQRGHLPRGVRYTPANLARALVQQALVALGGVGGLPEGLTVLDPACGSGIFLQECLRELSELGREADVELEGMDVSPVAAYVARFCLEQCRTDLPEGGFKAQFTIAEQDALQCDWPRADLVLMNPPFVRWQELDSAKRDAVRQCLGPLFRGRPDLAMAFLLKAVNALKPGGVMASVLPAALLANQSGKPLRECLGERADIVLVGRFEGYRYFAGSVVEPAFVVLRRRSSDCPRAQAARVLIAEQEAEDAALRLMRVRQALPGCQDQRVDLFTVRQEQFQANSWLPQRESAYRLRELLEELQLPTVEDLFDVKQGARTGCNAAFVLRQEDVEVRLPEPERVYFRPVAGQGTVLKGRLVPRFGVFYPYGVSGIRICDGQELEEATPVYYRDWLREHKKTLTGRARVRKWWALSEPRAWQYAPACKLVSTYFGSLGSFAYDDQGDYVVVQGFAWLWKARMAPQRIEDRQVYLSQTELPWAYLALLNSGLFARILACYCPRVQGGQFNLSKVKPVPIPDLSDPQAESASLMAPLAELGRLIHAGKLGEVRKKIDVLSARAYRVPDSLQMGEW